MGFPGTSIDAGTCASNSTEGDVKPTLIGGFNLLPDDHHNLAIERSFSMPNFAYKESSSIFE